MEHATCTLAFGAFPNTASSRAERLDELQVGARIERDEEKSDPLDFALWKGASADEWGWDSLGGRGRPGWHIECSAMSGRVFGPWLFVHTERYGPHFSDITKMKLPKVKQHDRARGPGTMLAAQRFSQCGQGENE